MNHVEVIKSVYGAFSKGDVPGILEFCAENVDWDNSRVASVECPWNGNFKGRKNVPKFFEAVGEHLDIVVFEPKEFLHNGNHVAVHLRIESTVKRTGKKILNDAIHFWTFDTSNRISAYRHYNDTAAELAAWKK